MRALKPQAFFLPFLFFTLIGCGGSSTPPNTGTGWTQVTAPGPSPRWAPVAVLDSKRRQIVLYGGAGGGAEVWLYSLDAQTWQRIDAPNGPPPLSSAGAVADSNNDRMILYGGSATVALNQTWAFSFADHTWSSLPNGPPGRFDIGATSDGKHAWFYGGYLQGFVPVNELWQFDLSSNTWSMLPQGSTLPSPRTNMAIGFLSGFLYMFGGHDLNGLTPGTWRYDLSTLQWTPLMPSGTPGAGAHFGYDTDQSCGDLILAGGDNDDTIDVATTAFLSLNASPQFVPLTAETLPPVRRHAVLILDPQTRTLFLFGGLQGTGLPVTSTILGDTWLYHLGACP
jgi:hypothetical protein